MGSGRIVDQGGFIEEVQVSNMRHPSINVQNLRLGVEYDIGPKTTAGLLLTGYERLWKTRDFTHNHFALAPDSTLVTDMNISETNCMRDGMMNISIDHSFKND